MRTFLCATVTALAVASRARPPAPAPDAGWTRLRPARSAACEVLARSWTGPDLPYPYLTTYVLRRAARTDPGGSCTFPTPPRPLIECRGATAVGAASPRPSR